jgi:phosphatidylglycerophosphatase A
MPTGLARPFWAGLATVGFGYAPVAPGTFGTIPGVVLWYFAFPYLGLYGHLALCVALTAISAVAAHRAAPIFGEVDAGAIVIDEVAGVMWCLLFLPHGVWWAVAGFVVFRFFDITKIWPASYFDKKMKNGLGVTLDDVVAGVYGCIVLNVAAWWLGAHG